MLDILTPPAPGAPIWTDDSIARRRPATSATAPDRASSSSCTPSCSAATRRRSSTSCRNPGGTETWQRDVEAIATVPVWPNFSGALDPELVYFGFPLPPEGASNHWLVLEEPPPGYRFKKPTNIEQAMTNAAGYAKATLHQPVRAFFGNLL